jgi:hypothetical protein
MVFVEVLLELTPLKIYSRISPILTLNHFTIIILES